MFDPCCEKSNYKMSAAQNVMLRVAIVLGMMVAVVAILYLTPLPEQHFKSCDRPCHDLDWPMICRVKIEVETPKDIRNCEVCAHNFTNWKELITVNRQIPGPSIQVCQNDILVVDVVNKIPGHSLTVHWRGQVNNEAPYMDGVPLVTQCPIPSYTTFQYKFRASTPGTHLYHAHSGHDLTMGLFGALVVRRPEKMEPQRKHYDEDSKKNIILISESLNNSLLINGKSGSQSGSALPAFGLQRNQRFRFRAGFVGGQLSCPVTLRIDNHVMKVIALDGNPIGPIEVDSIVLSKGERVDFVLKTNQNSNEHFVRVNSCAGDGLALINYESGRRRREDNVKELKKEGRSFDTALCQTGVGRVCSGDVRSLQKMPEKLRQRAEKVVYLSFGSRVVNVNDKFSTRIYGINNLTFTYPSSPLLTQLGQISLSSVCDEVNVPEKCRGQDVCECVHVEYIPMGSTTEIVLINQDEIEEEHVFHLHGYRFYVVGHRQFREVPSVEEIKVLDRENGLFKRNFNNPPLKDTIRISRKGVVAVRFLANNPGFWMLRDEKSGSWTRGMDIVFQVGDSADMISPPSDFPTCGNYIGPDFFLM